MSRELHDHDDQSDPFRALDVLIWGSVAVIAVIALEWFAGKVIRERIARGATRYLKTRATALSADGTDGV